MTTTITEIAPDIYRLSTFVDEANLTMNQFLVDGEEPLLFHTGQRALFTSASDALSTLIDIDRLKWITFGHVEADECGSMNSWLAAAPKRKLHTVRWGASSRSTIWPIGRHFPCRTATYSKPAAAESGTSTPHTSHTVGTRA